MARNMITLNASGTFPKTSAHLKRLQDNFVLTILNRHGPRLVQALRSATPVESGETANSWYYEVGNKGGFYWISLKNSHVEDGVNIAILLQYGHGTGTGGYVIGRDFINPVVVPEFEKIAKEVFEEVKSK